jgi:carboxypeptidase family protein
VSFTRWRLVRMYTCRSLFVIAGIVYACGRGGSHGGQEITSLYLACASAWRGVHCQLLALSRDVSQSPRDVTAEASWRLSGVAGARISPGGVIEAPEDGDLEIDAQFQARHATAHARLRRDRPGQMLAALRGRVYVERDGALRPVAHARVEVVGGPSVGLSTTTAGDGSYEFVTLVPGDALIRATHVGCTAAEGSTQIRSGDNRLSLLIEFVPLTSASAL